MANAGPDTNKAQESSLIHVRSCYGAEIQFFITYAKQASLDGKYSIFGK
jgi:cyclophilin family peptidyl-prolyl cis-trans isomerase